MAVSAYYMHRKTLTQLLEFAKSVEQRDEANENGDYSDAARDSPQHARKRRVGHHARRKGGGYSRRVSASLPDVTVISGGDGGGDERRRNGTVPVEEIPTGLPRLRSLKEGTDSLDLVLESSVLDLLSRKTHV